MAINKIANLKLYNEPYLKPISDIGIGFYNLDINSATLNFQVTRKGKPMLVGEPNTTAYAVFISKNGSRSETMDLEVLDALNGVLTITLPNDFLQASTETEVVGQVYLSPSNKEDTVVLNEFTFKVKDALINQIDADTKISYIRMFDDLKLRIEAKVQEILDAIKDGVDYVQQVKDAVAEAKTDINTIVNNGKLEVKSIADTTKESIENSIISYRTEIADIANGNIATVNSTKDEALEEMNAIKTDITNKVAGFKTQSELENVFLKLSDANTNYLTKEDATTLYVNKNEMNDTFTKDYITTNYYTKTATDTKFQTITNANQQKESIMTELNTLINQAVTTALNNAWESLFIGNAMITGSTYQLAEGTQFNQYKTIRILLDDGYNGSEWHYFNPSGLNSIQVGTTNLHNTLATAPVIMEFAMDISQQTQFTITRDFAYTLADAKGNTTANRFKILRIEGSKIL
ncbi:BppU family phage baseplate upper protein [Mammaliicoccus sciuri]|uniref:BppU family phage baseplate upper protein n=1 Tax=Mammaliicoccus sciuri TaxID=1296 RepID=UPI001951CDCE|nr:BppU family phage baseplate upper protein [Mammaliicoccus sciuri]